MPNVIVTCTFNPPSVTIQGASIRQDTIDALQRALPKQTTTSLPTQRPGESAKFLLTNGNGTTNGSNGAGRIEAPRDGMNAPAADTEDDSQQNNSAAGAAANGDSNEGYKSWRIDLGQHYCDQKGRAMISLVIVEALEEEGFALRGTHTVVTEREKDVTRLIFARA